MVKWMQRIFRYLDQFYVDMHSKTKLNDQGLKIFKEVIFKPLCETTTASITTEIRKQRSGEQNIDQQILKDSVEIYLQLSTDKLSHDGFLPRIILDKAIVEQTQQFYAHKCKESMDQTTLIDYLKVAQQHYEEEKKRIE